MRALEANVSERASASDGLEGVCGDFAARVACCENGFADDPVEDVEKGFAFVEKALAASAPDEVEDFAPIKLSPRLRAGPLESRADATFSTFESPFSCAFLLAVIRVARKPLTLPSFLRQTFFLQLQTYSLLS